jgi:hypothetical protein
MELPHSLTSNSHSAHHISRKQHFSLVSTYFSKSPNLPPDSRPFLDCSKTSQDILASNRGQISNSAGDPKAIHTVLALWGESGSPPEEGSGQPSLECTSGHPGFLATSGLQTEQGPVRAHMGSREGQLGLP